MGLFNVLRLANDYNKAKKFVEDKLKGKRVDIEKAKALVEKLKELVEYIKTLLKDLERIVAKEKTEEVK